MCILWHTNGSILRHKHTARESDIALPCISVLTMPNLSSCCCFFQQDTKKLRFYSRLQATIVSFRIMLNYQRDIASYYVLITVILTVNHRYGQIPSWLGTHQSIHMRRWSCPLKKSGPQNSILLMRKSYPSDKS